MSEDSQLFICTNKQVGAQFETKDFDASLPQTDEDALTWIPKESHLLYQNYRGQGMTIVDALTKTLEFYIDREMR